ncbi:MAG: PQQ-binding-like beta-propeller repeat protein [Muribaculaceae bacterium]|nr:PQQ-binding-like beta-propeller repeat protein [Muribaculaceae bacterium]
MTLFDLHKRILPLALAVGILASAGCGSRKQDSQATEGDSLATDSIATQETVESIERLPDTVYTSAAKISHVIEVKDSAAEGRIDNLTNLYGKTNSILTFRKGPLRQGDFKAKLDSLPTSMKIDWTIETELERKDTVYGPWGGGTGWTGQPLYVEWPDSVAAKMKRNSAVTGDFTGKEVIFGSLCGKLYFLNPQSGKFTRQPVDVGNPIKGTASVDPTFNGNIYVGQGVPASRPFGAKAISLLDNKTIDFMPEDPKAWRHWGAYDSSPIRVGQFLFRPAENGSLYKYLVKANGEISLQATLRYKVNGAAPGIESSMAVYANYGFLADNHGNILAVNLDNLKPVWHYSLDDDTDASPMVAIEDEHPYVYVGCEIDRVDRGFAKFAKLNAITGEKVWEITPEGRRYNIGKKHFDGGFYASPLLGEGDCADMIFTNRVKNTNGQNGVFMAISRKDGKVLYETPLAHYSWSSPAGLQTKDGQMLIVTADGSGNLYLIEGKSGRILIKKSVGYNFESSPIIINNTIYIGSRSNGLNKITLL